MTSKSQQFWDKQARKYDEAERQFAPVYASILAKTGQYLHPEDQVLDFGCATGSKTIQLAAGVRHILGLDFSGEMIREASRKKEESGIPTISFSQGTIYSNDFEKASFDSIIAYGIIHLLEDKEKVIRRIYDLLKPQGFFISTIACFKDKMAFKNRLEFLVCRFSKQLGMLPLHINRFSADEAKELIKNHHFQIIEADELFSGITSIFIVARKL